MHVKPDRLNADSYWLVLALPVNPIIPGNILRLYRHKNKTGRKVGAYANSHKGVSNI